MPRGDPLHLQVLGRVAGQLECKTLNFSRKRRCLGYTNVAQALLLPFDHVNVGLPPCSHLFHKQSCWLNWTNRVNNSMEDSHWYLRYRRQVLWSVKDKMDVLHELLQIKDIVEGPAKDGAGEGESHGVEGAVQDDPVHPVALGLADRRGVRGDPRSHGVAVDDQLGLVAHTVPDKSDCCNRILNHSGLVQREAHDGVAITSVIHGEGVVAKTLEDLVGSNSVRCTSVLGIAVEEDEDGVLGGETPNAQSTKASAITTVLAFGTAASLRWCRPPQRGDEPA